MQKLNFPDFKFRFKNSENKIYIFDEIRKKFFLLTPEEWVRQNVLHYFLHIKKYSRFLINIEKVVKINGQNKRYDLVLYNTNGSIHILVECKEPNVKITQQTFDQIARYNGILNAEYLMVTNGLTHYYCKLDYKNEVYHFLNDIP